VAPQLQKFCRSLAAAKLMAPAELEKAYRHWRATEPDRREDVKSFARVVVQQGQVSAEQVAKLLKQLDGAAETPVASAIDVELVVVPDPVQGMRKREFLWAAAGAAIATAIVVPLMWLTRPSDSVAK
jgi:hypothetical protein